MFVVIDKPIKFGKNGQFFKKKKRVYIEGSGINSRSWRWITCRKMNTQFTDKVSLKNLLTKIPGADIIGGEGDLIKIYYEKRV